jgi:amidase
MPFAHDRHAIAELAGRIGLVLEAADLDFFAEALRPLAEAHRHLEALVPPEPGTRAIAWRPGGGADDRFNCWRVKATVPGAAAGPAFGKRVGVKDNIAVAGLPMTNGSRHFSVTPHADALVVARLLAAGATVIGKTSCEAFASSGGSHFNDFGAVCNPRAPHRTSGGSSSGSAAAVAAGECDWALATDQGGSTRVPAAFCGVVGLKPTWGLVPYDGAIPVEATLDHIGLLTATVADNRRMLEVVAGEERASRPAPDPRSLRIGVVEEGFGHPNSEPAVDTAVREAAATFARVGCQVETISIPEHRASRTVFAGIVCSGAAAQLLAGSSYPLNARGPYDLDVMRAHRRLLAEGAPLPDTLLSLLLAGGLALASDGGLSYARAQHAARGLRAAYDDTLDRYDLLLMPTVPMRAPKLVGPDADRAVRLERAVDMFANCSAFNVTGHPALSVPCGPPGELPVGMMLLARHFHEGVLHAAGETYEQSAR